MAGISEEEHNRLATVTYIVRFSANFTRWLSGHPDMPKYKSWARQLAEMTTERAGALIVFPSPMLYTERRRIVDLAAKHRLPAIYAWREPVEAGGLMSYGASIPDLYRRAATHVDKILKGAKPADLPVEQPTKFELIINLKNAKALRLTIPQSVLVRADEVIQ